MLLLLISVGAAQKSCGLNFFLKNILRLLTVFPFPWALSPWPKQRVLQRILLYSLKRFVKKSHKSSSAFVTEHKSTLNFAKITCNLLAPAAPSQRFLPFRSEEH